MALQYVGGRTSSFAGTSTGTINIVLDSLSGGIESSPRVGDLIIVSYAVASSSDRRSFMAITPGFTTVVSQYPGAAATYETSHVVAYKFFANPGSDDTITVQRIGTTSSSGAVVVHVWRGVDQANPLDVEPVLFGQSTTGTATATNPNAITPVTAGAQILVIGASASDGATLYTNSYASNFITVAYTAGTYDAVAGIGSVEWTSGTYDPLSFVGGSGGKSSASWSVASIALRPVGSADLQTLTPSLATNTQTFYDPTAAAGEVGLLSSRLSNAQSFYNPTLGRGAVALTASRLSNSQAFYAPVVGREPVSLAASLVSNAQSFLNSTVEVGTIALQLLLTTNKQNFYQAQVTTGIKHLQLSRVESTQIFYEAIVRRGPTTLSTGFLTPSSLLHAPSLLFGLTGLRPELLSNVQSFYGAGLITGPVSLVSPQLITTQAFFPVTISTNALVLKPFALNNGSTLYAPAVSTGGVLLLPASVANAPVFFAPAVIAAGRTLLVDPTNTTQTFFAPTVLARSFVIVSSVIPNHQEFGSTLIEPGAVNLSPLLLNQVPHFYAFQIKDRLIIRFGKVSVKTAVETVSVLVLVDEAKATWADIFTD